MLWGWGEEACGGREGFRRYVRGQRGSLQKRLHYLEVLNGGRLARSYRKNGWTGSEIVAFFFH